MVANAKPGDAVPGPAVDGAAAAETLNELEGSSMALIRIGNMAIDEGLVAFILDGRDAPKIYAKIDDGSPKWSDPSFGGVAIVLKDGRTIAVYDQGAADAVRASIAGWPQRAGSRDDSRSAQVDSASAS